MSLTAAEQAELEMLEKQHGGSSSGLTAEEQAELAALEKQFAGPSVVDSAVRKSAQGLTGGFSDEVVGGMEALGRTLGIKGLSAPIYKDGQFFPETGWASKDEVPNLMSGDGIDKLIKAYEDGKNRERGNLELDAKTNPLTSAGFDLAGSILSPVNKIMPGKGIIKGMQAGVAQGAIQGLGRSEKDSLSGMAADTVDSAGMGAFFGGAVPVLGKVVDYAAPKLGSMASGIREDVIRKAKTMIPELDLAKQNPQIALQKIKAGKDAITGSFKQSRQGLYKEMKGVTDTLDESGDIIPIDDIVGPIKEKIASLRGPKASPSDLAKANALEEMTNNELLQEVKQMVDGQEVSDFVMPESVNASTAIKLYKSLGNLAEDSGLNWGNRGTVRSTVQNATDPEVTLALKDASQAAKNSIVPAAQKVDPKLAQRYSDSNDMYAEIKQLEDDLFNVTKNPKAFDQFLRKNDTVTRGIKSKVSQVSGKNLDDLGTEIQTYNMFSKPSWSNLSLDGSTSTSRTIPMAALGGATGAWLGRDGGIAGMSAGALAGSAIGSKAGSTAMLMKMMKLGQMGSKVIDKSPRNVPFNVYLQMKADEEK